MAFLLERVGDCQVWANPLAVLQVFGVEDCAACACGRRDDPAVIDREAVAAHDVEGLVVRLDRDRLDITGIPDPGKDVAHLVQAHFEFLRHDIHGLVEDLDADRAALRKKSLNPVSLARLSGERGENDVGVEEWLSAHWPRAGRT